MNSISLFSGIGAFELAAQLIFEDSYKTVQFVEIDPNAQKVLQAHFPNIPIWADIRNYHPPNREQIRGATVIIGGFPCTDTSSAGKRKGLAGSESGLWWEMFRIVCEFQPEFVVVENPEGLIHRGLREVLASLRMAGYQTEVELISAAEVGAPHKRSRIFIIAHANYLSLQLRQGWCGWDKQIGEHIASAREITSYSQGKGLEGKNLTERRQFTSKTERPETQSSSVRLDDGIPPWLAGIDFDGWWRANSYPIEPGIKPRTPGRRDCINLYGRSIVPAQAAVVLMRLKFLTSLLFY